jgi:hypothetical protein
MRVVCIICSDWQLCWNLVPNKMGSELTVPNVLFHLVGRLCIALFVYFAVLGLELRACTLSPSTPPHLFL